jgi:hypothetical protein
MEEEYAQKHQKPMSKQYFQKRIKPMSLHQLERELESELGPEAPSRQTLRVWRKNPEYRAFAYNEGVIPPEGAWVRPDEDAELSDLPDEGAAKK